MTSEPHEYFKKTRKSQISWEQGSKTWIFGFRLIRKGVQTTWWANFWRDAMYLGGHHGLLNSLQQYDVLLWPGMLTILAIYYVFRPLICILVLQSYHIRTEAVLSFNLLSATSKSVSSRFQKWTKCEFCVKKSNSLTLDEVQNFPFINFVPILMVFICDLQIDLIIFWYHCIMFFCEPHPWRNCLASWHLIYWHIFDNLTHDVLLKPPQPIIRLYLWHCDGRLKYIESM